MRAAAKPDATMTTTAWGTVLARCVALRPTAYAVRRREPIKTSRPSKRRLHFSHDPSHTLRRPLSEGNGSAQSPTASASASYRHLGSAEGKVGPSNATGRVRRCACSARAADAQHGQEHWGCCARDHSGVVQYCGSGLAKTT